MVVLCKIRLQSNINLLTNVLHRVPIAMLYVSIMVTKMLDFYLKIYFSMGEEDSSASPPNESRHSGMNEEPSSDLSGRARRRQSPSGICIIFGKICLN